MFFLKRCKGTDFFNTLYLFYRFFFSKLIYIYNFF